MTRLWTPAALICRICHERYPLHRTDEFQRHVQACAERHAEYVDSCRPAPLEFGDPELAAFAREEGDVYNRRAGTRRQPR